MAKTFRDIRRSRDYWSFLNVIAEQEENGQPLDETTAKVFADFLEENGDARHVLARAATAHMPYTNNQVSLAHPSLAHHGPVTGPETRGLWALRTIHKPLVQLHVYDPIAAFQENAHSGVHLYRIDHFGGHGVEGAPILHWTAHIPKTVSTKIGLYRDPHGPNADRPDIRVSRTARLTAPVTVAELHSFIDAMPNSATKVKWRQVAHDNQWYHPSYAHLMEKIGYRGIEGTPTMSAAHMMKVAKTNPPPRKLAREDKKKIGARIRELIATGMDRKKAVKQAVRECRAVKLSRAGTETERQLLQAITGQQHEDTSWLALADHLDESDRPAEAARIRWWIGARQHMNSQPVTPFSATDSQHRSGQAHRLADAVRPFPQWIQRALSADITIRRHADKPVMMEAAMLRHKGAFGLVGPEDYVHAEGKARSRRARVSYHMAYTILTDNPHTGIYESNSRFATGRDFPLPITEPIFVHTRQGDWKGHHQTFHEEASRAEALGQYMQTNPPPTETPRKLARVTPHARAGLGGSVRQSMTDSHSARLDLARKIVHEAGLTPATVRAAIAATGRQTRPSAVIAVQNSVSPEHAAYAAAWYGMLAGEPSMQVFHPGEGPHTLHIMDSPHPTDHVVNFLTKAGVPSFTVERRGPGSRVYTVSTDQSFDPWQLARGLDARHSRIAGQATRVGSSSDTASDPGAAARAAYRDTIRSVERRAFSAPAESDTGPVS